MQPDECVVNRAINSWLEYSMLSHALNVKVAADVTAVKML